MRNERTNEPTNNLQLCYRFCYGCMCAVAAAAMACNSVQAHENAHYPRQIKQLIKHLSVSNQWWINFKWFEMQVATNANEFTFSHSFMSFTVCVSVMKPSLSKASYHRVVEQKKQQQQQKKMFVVCTWMDGIIDLTHTIQCHGWRWSILLNECYVCVCVFEFDAITFVHSQTDKMGFSLVWQRGSRVKMFLFHHEGRLHSIDSIPKPKAMIEITERVFWLFFFHLHVTFSVLISHIRWQFYAYTAIVNSFDV